MRRKRCAWGSSTLASWASATPRFAQTEAVTDGDLGRGEAMLFLAGDGVDDRNGYYYFLPHIADRERLKRTGVNFSDIQNTLYALSGKVVLFIDTCRAGGVTQRPRRSLPSQLEASSARSNRSRARAPHAPYASRGSQEKSSSQYRQVLARQPYGNYWHGRPRYPAGAPHDGSCVAPSGRAH
jgi:hypothetical protein